MKKRIKSVILENNVEKTIRQRNKKKKRILKNEESLRNVLENMKHNNICIIGVPEGEESEQGIENLFEKIMTENFPNLVKEKDTQIQEAWRVPNKMDPKRPTPRHIIIKMTRLKYKERRVKAARRKQ